MISATTNFKAALAAYRAGDIIYRLELTQLDGTAYGRVFTNFYDGANADWIESINDLSISINDLEGTMNQATFDLVVSDIGGAITADMPTTTFEGMQAILKVGFPGLAAIDYCTVFFGYVDSVDSTNDNLSYKFNLSDMTAKLSKVIYQTGDNGGPTSSDNIKTLNAHPIDLLLDILLNQVKYPASQVDVAGLQAYRDGPFAGMQFLFHLNQPQAALDFITKQLLVPLGGYLWASAGGVITAQFFYPVAGPVAVGNFGPDTWLKIPEANQVGPSASHQMVNTLQVSFDKDDAASNSSGNYMSISVNEYGPSVSKYNQYGEHTIQADGMRSGFQGFFIAALTARLIFMRYGFKNLMFDENSADSIWNTLLFESGDIIAVTHPQVVDRQAGVVGIVNKLFVILDKKINFNLGTTTFTMLDAGYLSTFGFYKIPPRTEPYYTAATTLDKGKYMFFCGQDGKYSNGDAGHTLG